MRERVVRRVQLSLHRLWRSLRRSDIGPQQLRGVRGTMCG
jgi:hypothetical protein